MFKFAALAAIAAALSTPALASDRAWQVGNDSMHIYNSDLDMNSAAGRAAMLARIERVAVRLCRDRADVRTCAADVVAATLVTASAAPARLAMAERSGVGLAAR